MGAIVRQGLRERSGWKVLVWGLLAWVAVQIPQWAQMVSLPEPWGQIFASFAGFVASGIRLYLSWAKEPSVSARQVESKGFVTVPPRGPGHPTP